MACITRARSARFYGKLLMPVTALTFSVAMWSDPTAQAQVQSTFEDFKPMIEAAMEGRPVEEIIAAGQQSQFAKALAAEAIEAEALFTDKPAGLPASKVPVNRPDEQIASN